MNREFTTQFFRKADQMLGTYLRDHNKTLPSCRVVLVEDEIEETMNVLSLANGVMQINLPEDTRRWRDDDHIRGRIIAAMLLQRTGINPGRYYRRVPEWISAACIRGLGSHSKPNKIPGIKTYPGTRILMERGAELKLRNLLRNPLSPSDGPAYRIYAENAEILLRASLRMPQGRSAFRKYLAETTVGGMLPDNAFPISFKDTAVNPLDQNDAGKKEDEESQLWPELESWFNDTLRQAAINVFNPASAKFAEKSFRELENISYKARQDADGERRSETDPTENKPVDTTALLTERACRLTELPDHLTKMEDPEILLAGISRQFTVLHYSVPQILQPPLTKIISACRTMQSGKTRGIKAELQAARKEYFEALDRMAAIEKMMAEQESANIPPGIRYAPQIKVIKRHQEQQKKIWPAVYELMEHKEALLFE